MKTQLFLAGLTLVLLPTLTQAASPLCESIRTLTPVSTHYVSRVLERAKAGIEVARQNGTATTGFSGNELPSASRQVASAWLALVDVKLRLDSPVRSVFNETSCQRFDEVLIECQMDDVRAEMQAALQQGSMARLLQLEAVLEFLNDSLLNIAKGARDPNFVDPHWAEQKFFENEAPAAEEPMCPFDADYAEAFSSGYGCDASVLGARAAYPPAASDLDALIRLTKGTNFSSSSHQTAFGCRIEGGRCTLDPGQECVTDADCGMYSLGSCVSRDLAEVPRFSPYGPFSIKKNALEILRRFKDQREQEGAKRKFDEDLKLPYELEPDSIERQALESDPIARMFRSGIRPIVSLWSQMQGGWESEIYPRTDAGKGSQTNGLAPLRQQVSELNDLAGTIGGLRKVVIGTAYFLRRTCIYRPCNLRLEQILRIAYADACFPYANGEYLADSPDDPRWKKCALQACVRLEGMEDEDFPPQCEGIMGGTNTLGTQP